MKTVILQNKTRVSNDATAWSIEVIGSDGDTKNGLKDAIRALAHHPAKAARRSLMDMMALIEESRLEIKYTEHFIDGNDADCWMFILQGR